MENRIEMGRDIKSKTELTADQVNMFSDLYSKGADSPELAEFVYLSDINDVFAYRLFVDQMASKVRREIDMIEMSRQTFNLMEISYSEEDVKEAEEELNVSLNEHKEMFEKVNVLICKRQQKCQHEFDVVEHDSHHDHYVCKKCGLEEWV